MANHDEIYKHLCEKKDNWATFNYNDITKLTGKILPKISSGGKYYAVIKFLQKYCSVDNQPIEKSSTFFQGDPRQFKQLDELRENWEFSLVNNKVFKNDTKKVTLNVSKKENLIINQYTKSFPFGKELKKFPELYKKYNWNGKHKLYGYPSDTFPNFEWIHSLEKRFAWFLQNSIKEKTASKYLIQEMIEWGGSQNGVLQKFNDGNAEINLYQTLQNVILNIDDVELAIQNSMLIPGFGLTYASKLLRFLKPEKYGALDSRIRGFLEDKIDFPKIYDGNIGSTSKGYKLFIDLLEETKLRLHDSKILKPECSLSKSKTWNNSEIEMSIFYLANGN